MKRPLILASIAAALLVSATVVAAPAQATTCGFVTYQDGTFGPVVCKDGNPNTRVKAKLTKATPDIMALASDSTRKQIQAAVCADEKSGATGTMLYDAVEYQTARYDWRRSVVHPVVKNLIADDYC